MAILVLAGLNGGVAGAEHMPPLPRPRPVIWLEPRSFAEAAGPNFKSAAVTSAPSDCRLRLEQIAVVEPMPRLIGPGGCGGGDMVELGAVRLPGDSSVAFRPAPLLRCAMAETLATWIREDVAPRMVEAGVSLSRVETYDDFECRGRNRVNDAKLSEHGKGNAVDVRAFTLADSRVLAFTDTAVPRALRESIRESACARFATVLGPGSDGYHEAHIHLDLAERHNGYRVCQWEVREPPPLAESAEIVPLPPPRPAIAGAPIKDGRKL